MSQPFPDYTAVAREYDAELAEIGGMKEALAKRRATSAKMAANLNYSLIFKIRLTHSSVGPSAPASTL